jgi:GTPase SAR1 family protein
VVFDLTSRETFDAVVNWKRDVDNKVELPNGQKLPVLLLGNKSDLLDKEQQCVSDSEIDQVTKDLGFFKFAKVSAMTGDNLHAALTELTHEVARRMQVGKPADASATNSGADQKSQTQQQQQQQQKQRNNVDLTSQQPAQSDGGCC